MDVRCPQCQTLYELDDQQVGQRSVTLKCSQCQHVFRLGGRSAIVEENTRRWMVRRKKEGDILYLTTFDVLHDWIMKRTICQVDDISRTGKRWSELGSISEFQPMFQVLESISALTGAADSPSDVSSIAMRVPSSPEKEPASSREEPTKRERIQTTIQYGNVQVEEQPAPLRTEDVTKKLRHPEPMGGLPPSPHIESDEATRPADPEPLEVSSVSADFLGTADISRELPAEPVTSAPGVGIWVILAVVAVGAAGVYFWSQQSESTDKPTVAIGATNQSTKAPTPIVDPTDELHNAIDEALTAAASENDGIWTMWHETASAPFYIALDTAYAEADKATVGVELEDQLRDARVALENGHLEKASNAYREVLAKDPHNAAAVSGLGWALLELGRAAEAVEQFEKSIEIKPALGDAYIGLGSAHRQLGQLKQAFDSYDRYLGRFPKGPKASIASYQMDQLRKQLGM